ncbi:unnamed protein product [Paramecium sonneborni]|uniref:RNA-directed RNA polymerase n=1 Tax=Paramecium sonneborni TaxID=65129 RepID=A0A8S1LNJ8_9CILI|nr:unnamed protein product [Paramecium sonneborni]
MQTEIKIISQPPKKSAKEIYLEFKKWLQKNDINLNIYCIKFKPDIKDDNVENQIKRSQFWNSKIQSSISENSLFQLIQKIEPKLLNESKFILGKQLDYCEMIDDILIKTQEELFGVPKWHPTIRTQSNQQMSQASTQCYVYFYGQDIQKLKYYEDEKNQKQITLFGKQCTFKGSSWKKDIQISKENYVSIPGTECSFGILNNKKFYQYWSTLQVVKYYQENSILLQDINLELQNTQVSVYFSLQIDTSRRINCLIQFQTRKDGNVKEIEYNKTYSNGGIIVDISKDGTQIHFYVKIVETPRCYIQENYDFDKYQNQRDIKYWRCQNFLQNDIFNIVQQGIIRQQSYLKFTVNHNQTTNENFYNFCQEIENQGYLEKFVADQHIQQKRISEFQQIEYIFQVKLCLNWMLLSAAYGRFKIIQPNQNFQNFIDQVKEFSPLTIAYQIKLLKQRKQEKKDKDTFQIDKFLDIVKTNAQRHNDDKLDEILLADFTPSGILPNYSLYEILPLQDLEICSKKQVKGKAQYKQNSLQEEIIKIRVRDENFEILRQKQFDKQKQKQILFSGYFRELFKENIKILDRNYTFFAYDSRALRKGEFYAINQIYFQTTYQYMFQQLMKSYKNNQRIVKCSQIQKIFNEHLNSIYSSVSLSQIQDKLLEIRFEQDFQKNYLPQGQLLYIKADTKQMNRKRNSQNNFNYKILMPQGKASSDVIKLINEIAFEGQNTDFCCFIIRYQNFKGIITNMANQNKHGLIRLYENMIQKHSPANEQLELLNKKIWVEKKKLDEIQILGIPDFKPCVLRLFQILNIINLDNPGGQIFEKFQKQYQKLKQQKFINQNDPNYDPFYQKVLKKYERKQEFLLPVKKGAYLMGVYDKLLNPDEVFINVQGENEKNCQVVKDNHIMIFKKNYLIEDGICVFQNTSQENQEKLKKLYKNVIVFSVHMLGEKFPQDEFDDKQKFVAIWDQSLIPNVGITQFDGRNHCRSFKNNNKEQDSNIQSSINQSFDEKDWISGLQEQAIDFFCIFQQSCNFNELKNIYTKVLLKYKLYQGDKNFSQIFDKIKNQIKIINLIGMKFPSTQAQKTNYCEILGCLKSVHKDIINADLAIEQYFLK